MIIWQPDGGVLCLLKIWRQIFVPQTMVVVWLFLYKEEFGKKKAAGEESNVCS